MADREIIEAINSVRDSVDDRLDRAAAERRWLHSGRAVGGRSG